MNPADAQPDAIILAAGKGTRMKSDLPKVAHPAAGRAMICAVVDACRAAGCRRVIVVVGYRQEIVRGALRDYPAVEFAVQDQQLGTGHAVACAEPVLRAAGAPASGGVFVLCGDGPLIRPETLREILGAHRRAGARATLATSVIDDPTGYGRIVRDADGRFVGIVEERNCTPAQRAIREVNPSYYLFDADALFDALRGLTRDATSGEYYLTDVPSRLMARGERVEVVPAVPPEDVLSINTPEELRRVDGILRKRQAGQDGPRGVGAGAAPTPGALDRLEHQG